MVFLRFRVRCEFLLYVGVMDNQVKSDRPAPLSSDRATNRQPPRHQGHHGHVARQDDEWFEYDIPVYCKQIVLKVNRETTED